MPTALDHSWPALLRPGWGHDWFDAHDPPAPVCGEAYDRALAWWSAELSRLIYRPGTDEIGNRAPAPSRAEILEKAGWRETCFIARAGTYCAIITPPSETSSATPSFLIFRGSSEFRNWLTDLNSVPCSCPEGGRVHRGFRRALDRVWAELDPALAALSGPTVYAGHSLGAALATLAAARRAPDVLYTFGSPRVGDGGFAETVGEVPVHRVVNRSDVVTHVPPPNPFAFTHVGEVHRVSSEQEIERGVDPPPRPRMRLFGPPRPFADHAPINYVALLQRELEGRRDAFTSHGE